MGGEGARIVAGGKEAPGQSHCNAVERVNYVIGWNESGQPAHSVLIDTSLRRVGIQTDDLMRHPGLIQPEKEKPLVLGSARSQDEHMFVYRALRMRKVGIGVCFAP